MDPRAPCTRTYSLRLVASAVVGLGALVSVFGPGDALPRGSLFALYVLYMISVLLGWVSERFGLPSLVGSIVGGFALRNLPVVGIGGDVDAGLASALRGLALVVILARAGLGLKAQALLRLSGPAIRLSVLPNLVEASAAAALLSGVLAWPVAWGVMAGFVLSAVSPAVVVPGLLHLQEERYGTDKGIPTLVLAAASFDDVLSISGFGVCLSLAFAEGDPVWAGLRGPLELCAGAVFGVVAGVAVPAIVPQGGPLGAAVLGALGVVAVLGGRLVHLAGGGALGVIVAGAVAKAMWARSAGDGRCPSVCQRRQQDAGDGRDGEEGGSDVLAVASRQEGGGAGALASASAAVATLGPPRAADPAVSSAVSVSALELTAASETTAPASAPVPERESGRAPTSTLASASVAVPASAPHASAAAALKQVWLVLAQPLLFGLIGAAVDVSVVDTAALGIGAAALAAGLLVRCAAAYVSVLGGGLTRAERLFVAIAWLPKATVQAAIGPVALDTALGAGSDPDTISRALAVLTIAVLAIVATAPAGAILIACLGKRWLARAGEEAKD